MRRGTRPSDAVYYRLLIDEQGDLRTIALQWFDEFDYDHGRYLFGDDIWFETEAAAEEIRAYLSSWLSQGR